MEAVRQILTLLDGKGALLTRQIAGETGYRIERVRGLCRCLAAHGLVHSEEGMHFITKEGRARLIGGFLPCQRQGRIRRDGSLRQKAWALMRMRDSFTVDDILSSLCTGDEKGAEENMRKFCRMLFEVGYLGRTRRSGAYFLKVNTGPLAPAFNNVLRHITDRNTGQTFRIGIDHVA